MQGQSYTDYMKMSPEQRLKYVNTKQQWAQQKPLPFKQLKYPEQNFVELNSVQNKKVIKLATYRHEAKQTKGVVAIFHGMCLHSGLSAILAERLANEGFTAVALDLMGHGKSQGERGYIDDQKQAMKDIRNFLKATKTIYPKVPLFLFGHGSGALLTLHASRTLQAQIQIKGVILASLSLKRPGNSKVLSAVSDVALKLMPNRTGLFSLDFVNASKNKAVTKYLQKDPLIHHEKVYVGNLMQFMKIMDQVDEKSWEKYLTPAIAIIQGQCDKVADPCHSIRFYEKIPTKDKELWYYKNLWNMVFFQEQYPQIENRIIAWLSKRI